MRVLFISFLFVLLLILVLVFRASSSSNLSGSDDFDSDYSQDLPRPLTSKHDAIIAVAPDGTVYYVEGGSGKILWSFSSGQSIYSSYQQIPNHEGEKLNASASTDGDGFYIDCGEDWELYLHTKDMKKVRLPISADDMVKRAPFVSAGGGVLLGSKKTAVYLVDAKTGKVLQTFRSDKSPSAGEHDSDQSSSLTTTDIEEWLPTSSVDLGPIEEPLYVTRTDYALKYTSMKTGEVLWYLMFADIEASYQCEGIEIFLDGFTHNDKFRQADGLDPNLPMHCKTKPVVYRIRDRGSLEPLLLANRLKEAVPGSKILTLPAPEQHATNPGPSLSTPDRHPVVPFDDFLVPHLNNDGILALPVSDQDTFIVRGLQDASDPQINTHVGSDTSERSHSWLPMIFSALMTATMAWFFYCRVVVARRQGMAHKPSEDVKWQKVVPKKRKARKRNEHSFRSGGIIVSEGLEDSGSTGRLFLPSRSDDNVIYTDVRKIGKLTITNKEIAKGSNGTIVLEGNYAGRSVAVKRLVRSHNSVANKEVQNLIASDQHSNIVRWYGIEHDQDFIYICLERCTCNLHELILACNSPNQVTGSNLDHESLSVVDSNMQLLRILGSKRELQLWKNNGYPSASLLKLMRDTVRGLVHLHDLGIIHRDLKPQNVLVIKDRSMSAKISDMGISKHLDREMSSLTQNATGIGSSGWQAPEQLRQQRQTRAVDLFSLGCILFFCMTGGNHPFGENLERDSNIVKDQKDLFLIKSIPEAMDLISRLLHPNPEVRPKAVEVMHHPLFWNSETRLSFLRDVSDRVELEDREIGSELLEALESVGKVAFGGKWDENLDTSFINDIGRYRRYKFNSARDLLRVIRNKFNHYRELSKEIQALLGSLPEGFDSYFSTRFPELLIEVYRVIASYCAEEEIFQKYFKSIELQ